MSLKPLLVPGWLSEAFLLGIATLMEVVVSTERCARAITRRRAARSASRSRCLAASLSGARDSGRASLNDAPPLHSMMPPR